MSTMSTKTPQMSDEEEEEDAGSTSGDIDEKQFLNKSLTSMDWLQRLNAKYVSLQQQGTISTTFAENQINFPTNTHVVDGYNNEDISKPNYSYVSLIKLALEQAPGFMATHDQICHWIEQTFPYYKSTSNEWKIFIKQALLMTPSCFLRINTADQNCYWTLSGKVPQIQPDNHGTCTLFHRRMSETDSRNVDMYLVNPTDIFKDDTMLEKWKMREMQNNFPLVQQYPSNDDETMMNEIPMFVEDQHLIEFLQ